MPQIAGAVTLFVAHRFALDEILRAYDTFGNAAKHGALKVALKAG